VATGTGWNILPDQYRLSLPVGSPYKHVQIAALM